MPVQRRKSARMVRRSRSFAVTTDSGESQTRSNSPAGSTGSSEVGRTQQRSQTNDRRLTAAQANAKKWISSATAGDRPPQELVDKWLSIHSTDPNAAFSKLLQYVVYFAGYTVEIERDCFQAYSQPAQLEQFVQRPRPIVGGGYPLRRETKSRATESNRMATFIDLFVKQAQEQLAATELYVEWWTSWLLTMCQSPILSFRHTGSFVCLKWNAALCGKLRNLQQSLQLLEVNQRKSQQDEPADSSDSITAAPASRSTGRQMDRTQELIAATRALVKKMEEVFVQRVVDVDHHIRQLCLAEYGFWLVNFPELYCRQRFLTCVAQLMNDKTGKIRLQCLQLVESLLDLRQYQETCFWFIQLVFDRLLKLSQLQDVKVSVRTIQVLHKALQLFPNDFPPAALDQLTTGVFSIELPVAEQSSVFLMAALSSGEDEVGEMRLASGKKVSRQAFLLINLAEYYLTNEFSKYTRFLARALVKKHPIFRDWSTWVDLLSERINGMQLSHETERALADLLLHFVKRCVKPPKDNKGVVRKVVSAADKSQMLADQEAVTVCFVRTLPALLTRFRSDGRVAEHLVKIAQYFAGPALDQFRDHLEELLESINRLVQVQSRQSVVDNCFKVYRHLLAKQNSHRQLIVQMFEQCVDQLRIDFMDGWAVDSSLDANMTLASKLLLCNRHHDLSDFQVWEYVFTHFLEPHRIHATGLKFARRLVACVRDHLLWQRYRCEQRPAEEDVSTEKKKIFEFVDFLKMLLTSEQKFLRKLAFPCLADLLVFFNKPLESEQGCVRQLRFRPDAATVKRLCLFVRNDLNADERPAPLAESSKISDLDESIDSEAKLVKPEVDIAELDEAHRLIEQKVFLYAFAKLILYGVIGPEHSPHMFAHYELMKELRMDDVIDRLFAYVLVRPAWGDSLANILVYLLNRHDVELAGDFVDHLLTGVPKVRGGSELASVAAQLTSFLLGVLTRLERRQSAKPKLELIQLLPRLIPCLARLDVGKKGVLRAAFSECTTLAKLAEMDPETMASMNQFRQKLN